MSQSSQTLCVSPMIRMNLRQTLQTRRNPSVEYTNLYHAMNLGSTSCIVSRLITEFFKKLCCTRTGIPVTGRSKALLGIPSISGRELLEGLSSQLRQQGSSPKKWVG